MPHHSPETAAPGSVPTSVLEDQLSSFVAGGWRLVGVTEALRRLEEDEASRVVALTFDDGLLDFLNAFEILQRTGARATLYVPTSAVGVRVSRWDPGHSRLGWEDIGHLAEAGVEIGSQSVHGRPLDVRPDAAVRSEVLESRRALEDRLALPVMSFCYPSGLASPRVRRAVVDAGYVNACTVDAPWPGAEDDVLRLPRIRVRPGFTPETLVALAGGSSTGIPTYLARTAKLAWRVTGRTAVRALHVAVPRG